MQGCERGEGKSKPEMGLRSLGQGSRIRARNGEGQAGSRYGVPKMELRFVEGRDTRWEILERAWVGDVWIGVPVRCYTECNKCPEFFPVSKLATTYESTDRPKHEMVLLS